MATVVQEVSDESSHTTRNTGFPEPLSPDRNTTLPHPDADTSKNACISGPDIPLQRTHVRNRSFLSRHHAGNGHHNLCHKTDGTISVEDSGLYDNITYADGSEETRNSKDTEQSSARSDDVVKDGEQEVSNWLDHERDEQGYRTGERKKGVLRKLGLHKV